VIKRLGVVGFGTMGSEIALLAGCAGIRVAVYSRSEERFNDGKKKLGKILRLLSRDDKFFAAAAIADDDLRQQVLDNITVVDSFGGLAESDCVIESIAEDLRLKHDVFTALSAACRPDAILASNTSSISITGIASAVEGPARVVGMHFFNPPSMMQLVEVIPGLNTDEATVDAALKLAVKLGKKGIRVKETPGFVVNRVLIATMNEAITLYEEGIASIEDIDEAMKLGAGMPMGPFRLADLVGLDVYMHTCQSLYSELGKEKFRPPVLLKQLVAAGRLGRKTRHGFYKY
jgi:3-hydroxybutyryl-CoA dehydrogenase